MRNRSSRRASTVILLVSLALAMTGCGSTTTSHAVASASATSESATSAAPTTATRRASGQSAGVARATDVSTPSTQSATPAECASAVTGTLGEVGERIYHEAATGGDVAQAVHRVQSSSALDRAIASANASAARAALQALLLGQIVDIEVLREGRVFATAGSGAAIAAVHGSIPGTGASFILSVQSDSSYVRVAQQVTGAQVLLIGPGERRLAGTIDGLAPASVPSNGPLASGGRDYRALSLGGGTVYPTGALRIALLVPASAISCPGSTAQARLETVGHVGEHVYQEELHSPDVAATVRLLESSPAFQRAVADESAAATRAAIIGFFEAHIHVVRVRVTIGSRLLVDVGGPYVLAPVEGTLHSGGRVIGQFAMAIQDDAGYLKLAHLFTGADVLMRTGSRQVMGTLSPGPASVPDRGAVSYDGRSYEAYSFSGEAFPSGSLRISLLAEPQSLGA